MYGSSGRWYGQRSTGTKVGQLVKGDNTGASTWQVAYTYAMSKRTPLHGLREGQQR